MVNNVDQAYSLLEANVSTSKLKLTDSWKKTSITLKIVSTQEVAEPFSVTDKMTNSTVP